MLKVKAELVEKVRAAKRPADLYESLQSAIELEHATIPLYLTAAYSIKDGSNTVARRIIRSVAIEEMLHMTIAANVANAIGYAPVIDKPGFIPLYPGPLPMHIHDGLTASLQKASRGLIYNVFMTIEEPEIPIKIDVKQITTLDFAPAPAAAAKGFATIGDFYKAVKDKLRELGNGIFKHPANPQVVDNTWFPASELFAVTDVDSAWKAIDIIVDQGEGTHASPLDRPGGQPAHYYRLAQIVFGRMLVEDKSTKQGWSYSGAAVPLDPAGIWNLYPDAKAVDYRDGSRERALVERFNYSYTSLLRAMHTTFNGTPESLAQALGLMYEMRLLVNDIVSTPVTGTDYFAAPTFEYTPLQT
jgi:rubrerythrin